jgi:predicted acetyltransferase
MNIEIVSAAGDQDVIRNLFAFYVHDLSEMAGFDVGDDGAYALPPSLALYWEGPDAGLRYPFLVRADGKPGGFALVKRIGPETYDMGEFFILRKFRRSGLGRYVACALFDRFAGKWEVRELPSNTPAQAFWRRIIGDYTTQDFEERQEFFEVYKRDFIVQRFRSRAMSVLPGRSTE